MQTAMGEGEEYFNHGTSFRFGILELRCCWRSVKIPFIFFVV